MVGVFGAVIGSFLNVVVHRVPRGESIATPGSRCPSCETPIAPYDNVPVISWVVLRGRCRHCGATISARYPAIEALVAGLFALTAALNGVDDDLVMELPFVSMLVAVAAIDLERHIIPNRILLPVAIWAVLAAPFVRTDDLAELALAGAGAFLFLLIAALVYPAGMGMGDVKLAGVMGLYLGLSIIPAMLIAFLAGSLVGIGMMLVRGVAARKTGIPFGPFLALGALAGLFAGPELIDLYSDNFL